MPAKAVTVAVAIAVVAVVGAGARNGAYSSRLLRRRPAAFAAGVAFAAVAWLSTASAVGDGTVAAGRCVSSIELVVPLCTMISYG